MKSKNQKFGIEEGSVSMFYFGDYVLNQKTGNFGQVIGYGNQIANNINLPTLKVLVAQAVDASKAGFVEEDFCSAWTLWQRI
jgi:hypothetical protein